MNFKLLIYISMISVTMSSASAQNALSSQMETEIIWEDDFTDTEKIKLSQWLEGVCATVARELGEYRFSVNLYVHLSDRGGEPVPWANTVRHDEQGVHFYVNPEYPLEAFQQDWTAPHELSHLSLPFLGRKNMWFAEGYASYMQWFLIEKQGVLSSEFVREKYREKLASAELRYQLQKPFPEVVTELLSRHDYPAVYWGGACYFFQVNALLITERKTDLFEVIRRYQLNERLKDNTIDEVVNSLDYISNSTIFSDRLKAFREDPAQEVISNTSFSAPSKE